MHALINITQLQSVENESAKYMTLSLWAKVHIFSISQLKFKKKCLCKVLKVTYLKSMTRMRVKETCDDLRPQ